MAEATVDNTGAEQATTRKRGTRGTGRRLRRAIVDAKRRRSLAVADLEPMNKWRAWVLARLDAEIAQLTWEQLIGWTGDPGLGPGVDNQPPPARPFELPREIFEVYLGRPWRTSL